MQESTLPREHLAPGQVACAYGESGDSAYIIEAGAVEVLSAAGRRLAVLGAGELFGEVALLDAKPRTATVRTLEATTLMRVERSHIQQLLKGADPVVRYLLTLLLERFRANGMDAVAAVPASRHPLEDEGAATTTLMLTLDLAHALKSGQLGLVYQPLVGFAQRGLNGYEALVRWHHPERGTIMPATLIALAEKTGLIHPLGAWVLRDALAHWPELRRHCQGAGGHPPFISVNLSASELAAPGIFETIRDSLAEAQVPAQELQVELTETVVIEDRSQVIGVLEDLSALGVAIALDDFGTGYAGLDYLKTLPISCLKIDQCFIQEIKTSSRCQDIVRSAVDLARTMNLATIGEGVEDEETARLLAGIGCQFAQGYYFAYPMPAEAIPAWRRDATTLGRLAPG